MYVDILLPDALGDLFFALGASRDIAFFHHQKGDYVRLVINLPLLSFLEKKGSMFDQIISLPSLHAFRHPIKNYLCAICSQKYKKRLLDMNQAHLSIKNFLKKNPVPDIIYELNDPHQKRISVYEKLAKSYSNSIQYKGSKQVLACFSFLQNPIDRFAFFALFLKHFQIPTREVYNHTFSWLVQESDQEVLKIKQRLYDFYHIKRPFVFLVPKASRHHKELPISFWYNLVQELKKNSIDSVIALFDDAERMVYQQKLDSIPNLVHFRLPSGRPALVEHLAVIIKESSFVVGVDTGITHLAALMGKRGIIYFHKKKSIWTTSIARTSFRYVLSEPSIAQVMKLLATI